MPKIMSFQLKIVKIAQS